MSQNREDRSLSYERPAGRYATVRQFRVLLILLLVNLAITIQVAYLPGLRAEFQQQWAAWQHTRRSKALQKQAMSFAEPSSKVVWDEDPKTAAALLANPAYGRIHVDRADRYSFLVHWPWGARAVVPAFAREFHGQSGYDFANLPGQVVVEPDQCALVLLHGFKTPAGNDRILLVYVKGQITLENIESPWRGQNPPLDRPWSSVAAKELTLVAIPCATAPDGTVAMLDTGSSSLIIYPPEERQPVPFTWIPPAGGKPEQIRMDGQGIFRFYAGQPDPADPSRFTIGYDLDGRHGIIRGRVRSDDSVEMQPDVGKLVGRRWYPVGK